MPVVLGLLASVFIEQSVQPRPKWLWQRDAGSISVHFGLWLAVFAIEFLQFRRPWMSTAIVSVIYVVMVLINHAKYQALREPFLYQDFDYFVDALKHPRLYLPFFGVWKIIGCVSALILVLWLSVQLEDALTVRYAVSQVWLTFAVVVLVSIMLLWAGNSSLAKGKVASFNAKEDIVEFGLLGSIWRYGQAERKPPVNLGGLSSLPLDSTGQHSHVIVVQSESFFDPRHDYSQIKPQVLQHFDRVCAQSEQHGRLAVDAWGANTVRTEFSFLTGIKTQAVGVDQFNPYRRLINEKTPSVVRLMKQRGYRTVCIHPYPASFYRRDRVFPLLGFDEFIDIQSFDPATKEGQYVSDAAVTDKVVEILAEAELKTEALFIFVITMENHGPLHLEALTIEAQQQWLAQKIPADCEDLSVYLKHLANADQMINRLTNTLTAIERPGILVWYGDHVPIMAKVYDVLGLPDGLTDYFIWSSKTTKRVTSGTKVKTHCVSYLAQSLISLID
jgi:hypothetical protein